jgi:hypothetical protein
MSIRGIEAAPARICTTAAVSSKRLKNGSRMEMNRVAEHLLIIGGSYLAHIPAIPGKNQTLGV